MLRTFTRTPRLMRPLGVCPFSQSSSCRAEGSSNAKVHGVDKVKKGDTNSVQTSNASAGMNSAKEGSGGHATEEKDSAGGVSKTKQEFPEAPDPAIGMQDERGGRGGK